MWVTIGAIIKDIIYMYKSLSLREAKTTFLCYLYPGNI